LNCRRFGQKSVAVLGDDSFGDNLSPMWAGLEKVAVRLQRWTISETERWLL